MGILATPGIKNITKQGAKLIGFDTGAIADASRRQAQATTEAAAAQSKALQEQSQQAQRSQETMAAQRQAADAAAALLNTPTKQAEVDISGGSANDNIDPVSGKRLKPRDAYSTASINI